MLEEFGANGVFSAEGAAWEPQRRLVMQALSVPHIKAVYPTLSAITERLHARWMRAAQEQRTVDMVGDLKRYTVDVTSALAFGEDPRTLEQERGVIQEHLALILPMLMTRINAPFPYWRYVKLPRDRKLGPVAGGNPPLRAPDDAAGARTHARQTPRKRRAICSKRCSRCATRRTRASPTIRWPQTC